MPLSNDSITVQHSLSNFLLRGVRTRIEDTSGQVMDETDPLGNANLLLLSQLAGQTTLTRSGMVHWHWLGMLLEMKEQKATHISLLRWEI